MNPCPAQLEQSPAAPRPLVRIANIVILGIALLFAIELAAVCLIGHSTLYKIVPLGLCLLFLACLWLSPAVKISLAVSCLSALFALYAAEIYFTFGSSPRSIGRFRKLPGSFDMRSAFAVISDLRDRGTEAHANLAGRLALLDGRASLESEKGPLLPLGGMSRRLIVFCNEAGRYVTYESDEYGFHNPAGLWSRTPISLAVLGDSFAQGFCTPGDQTFVAAIRQHIPQTVTLGMVGNGPLFELAALDEYLTVARPKTVLWVYFEGNDLQDLAEESRNPLLMRYLQGKFRQKVMERQPEIDRAWSRYENDLMGVWRKRSLPRWLQPLADWASDVGVEHRNRSTLGRILRLREIRGRLEARFARVRDEKEQLPLLRVTLARANTLVRSWGGTLHFVFLPSMSLLTQPTGARGQLAQLVLHEMKGLGIPVIDIRNAFRSHPVASLFFYPDSHYNEEGARLIAGAILSALDPESASAKGVHAVVGNGQTTFKVLE
jgi:hypothetical protein